MVRRPSPSQGEFDNSFDGVVSGIFHIVDAFELATTGLARELREADQSRPRRSTHIAARVPFHAIGAPVFALRWMSRT